MIFHQFLQGFFRTLQVADVEEANLNSLISIAFPNKLYSHCQLKIIRISEEICAGGRHSGRPASDIYNTFVSHGNGITY